MEALRDRMLREVGTDEPWFFDAEFYGDFKDTAVAAHWRKPLRLDEVSRMANTPEVRQRPGRP
jgi:hypothetical protein